MDIGGNARTTPYGTRSVFVQALSPAPKRHLQGLVSRFALHTGLDIGCGAGSPLTSLRGPAFRSTGLDVSPESIDQSRRLGLHDEYILGDLRTLEFPARFDVVVLSHVIEHLTREEGLEMLRRAEEVASKVVYVETPCGFLEQHELDGNVFQRHLSGWFPADFEARGYTVFGAGARWLHRKRRNQRRGMGWVTRNLDRVLQAWYFRRPDTADTISAIRVVDERGNLCSC